MKTIMAIDQGASGAIAWHEGGQTACINMPETPKDIIEFLEMLIYSNPDKEVKCFIEKVGGYVPGNSGPAAVKFARHCGHVEMALLSCRIPHQEVTPATWQKAVTGAPNYPKIPKEIKGTSRKQILAKRKQERKNKIKMEMQRRFPGLKVTLSNADALGILTYALMLSAGDGCF